MKKRVAAVLVLALMLVLGMGPAMAGSAEAQIWLNDATGTPYATLAAAVSASQTGDTIRVKGNFGYAAMQATIPSGRTLVIAGDTTVTGASGQNGFTVAAGAAIQCENGATLTMTGFNTAMTVSKDGQVKDGKYVFKNNAGANGTRGISIAGAVKGSADKNSVVITVDDKCATNTYAGTATFENCTVSINSQTPTWQDAVDLTMKNASLTVAGFAKTSILAPQGQSFFIDKLNMQGSDLTVNSGEKGYYATGATIQGGASVVDSTITINAGSRAGLSVGSSVPLNFQNSVLNINNSGFGGFNINTGKVTFDASTLRSNGSQILAAFGVQSTLSTSYVHFINGSNVETPASSSNHNGGSSVPNGYVVLGGSHRISYDAAQAITIPVNGVDNGNEKLDFFTLKDPAVTALAPININGASYSYAVPNASGDGQKYVWVPGDTVTFKLNNTDALFADGTKADKNLLAMRGYAVADATAANGQPVNVPGDPVAPGYRFLGWFNQADGSAFDPASTTITKDTTVIAKWESDAESYALVYHNGDAPDVTYMVTGNAPERKLTVLNYQDVVAARPDFAVPGMEFLGWKDQSGAAYAAGSEVTVPAETPSVHLYAQWNDLRVPVRFSANGGTFEAGSIFKTKPDVFTVEQDPAGGEVAVVKKPAVVGIKLIDLLQKLDPALTQYTEGLQLTSLNNTRVATREGYAMKPSKGTTSAYRWFTDPLGTSSVEMATATVRSDTTYYLAWQPTQTTLPSNSQQTLPADMWGPSQDTSAKVQSVMAGDAFNITAGIKTEGIKLLMQEFEGRLAEGGQTVEFSQIPLRNVTSSFVAKLTVPDGMQLPAGLTAADMDPQGFGDAFKVTNVNVSGSVLTVVMTFQGADVTNYQQLKDKVDSTGEWLTVTVKGLTLDHINYGNLPRTATGTVEGVFNATMSDGQNEAIVYIQWDGSQTQEGKDEGTPASDTRISYTAIPVRTITGKLRGDMLVNGDTEHTAVYEVFAGDTVALTGALNTLPIRELMTQIEKPYTDIPFTDIKIDVRRVQFTTTITLPAGMSFTGDAVTLEDFGDFAVKDTTVTGQTMTVIMAPTKAITTYQELHDLVFGAGDTDDGWMRITTDVIISDTAAAGTQLTAVGTVTGEMQAVATYGEKTQAHSFVWEAVQSPEGKDAVAKDDTTIQVTVVPVPVNNAPLRGDMLVNGDTEHTAVYEVFAGDTVAVTGALNTLPIRDQMKTIEQPYEGKIAFKDITVDVKKVQFTAEITLPAGMSFTGDAVTLEDFGEFTVSGKTVDGQKMTVTMTAPDSIENYQQLHDLVFNAGDQNGWMRVTIPGVKVSDTAAAGTLLTSFGTVTGEMQATATSPAGTTKAFSFAWKADQWPEGRDAAAPANDADIRLSVVPVPAINAPLPGDMLVNGDTEHTAVYEVFAGDTVAVTGALNVEGVREQMKAIEALYPNTDHAGISVDVQKAVFMASITLPDGMSFPDGAAAVPDSFGDWFEVAGTTVSGQTATVQMKLKDGITSYLTLKQAVDEAGDQDGWMRVTIPGVKVSDTAAAGTLLTSFGTVTGEMQASAWVPSGNRKAFSFTWNAVQWAEGKDAVATDDTTIQLTIVARQKPTPPPTVTRPPEVTDKPYDAISVVFSGQKKAVNHSLKGGDYAFTIKDGSGKVKQTVSNDANGNFVFSARTFSRTGTFLYTIEEVPGSQTNMVYDKTVYTAKVVTTSKGSTLEARVDLLKNGTPYDGQIIFVNRAQLPETGDNALAAPLALAVAATVMLVASLAIRKKKTAA